MGGLWTVFSVFYMVATGVPARIFSWAFSSLAHNFECKQTHGGQHKEFKILNPGVMPSFLFDFPQNVIIKYSYCHRQHGPYFLTHKDERDVFAFVKAF